MTMAGSSLYFGPKARKRSKTSVSGPLNPLRFLSRALEKDRLAHAYLFTGPRAEHHGRIAAKLLLCHSPRHVKDILQPCGTCPGCRKVERALHPDLHILEPDGVMIKVEQVRRLQKELAYPPLEGKRRVCLLIEAHTMNQEAANALLKTLEEPPERTYLILVTHSTKGLLPTVISRCQLVRCPPPALEEIQVGLPGPEHLKKLVFFISEGDLDKAMAMDHGLVEDIRNRILALRTAERPLPDLFRLADLVSSQRENTIIFIQIMKTFLRDLMVIQQYQRQEISEEAENMWKEGLIHADLHEQLAWIASHTDTDLLNKLAEDIHSAEALLERNINRTLLAVSLLLKWAIPE